MVQDFDECVDAGEFKGRLFELTKAYFGDEDICLDDVNVGFIGASNQETIVNTSNQVEDAYDSRFLHKSNELECDFVKLRGDSYLRVVYMGNIRITGCTGCCKRWYFTFNNAECKDPAPIDGSLYQGTNLNIHRPTIIEGYCGGIAAGKVRVGFSVGNCGVPFNTNGDAFTGSNQANRIIIEEVEPPVA
ncbi:hypothetical protein ACROYT_G012743 [Oculina patagonica]